MAYKSSASLIETSSFFVQRKKKRSQNTILRCEQLGTMTRRSYRLKNGFTYWITFSLAVLLGVLIIFLFFYLYLFDFDLIFKYYH